jgi:hypothetical protein
MNVFAANFNRDLFAERVVDIGDNNSCAFARKSTCHLCANATSATSNKSPLPRQLPRHFYKSNTRVTNRRILPSYIY